MTTQRERDRAEAFEIGRAPGGAGCFASEASWYADGKASARKEVAEKLRACMASGDWDAFHALVQELEAP